MKTIKSQKKYGNQQIVTIKSQKETSPLAHFVRNSLPHKSFRFCSPMQKHMESANGNQTMIQPYRPFQDKLPIVAKATLPTCGSFCNDGSSIPCSDCK